MNIAIVTTCPTGMVTSVLSARLLDAAAQRRGWTTSVEIHDGPEATLLTDDQLARAELVVVVHTGAVDLSRFVGKRVYRAAPAEALRDVDAFLQRAASEAKVLEQAPTATGAAPSASASANETPRLVAITACPTGVAHTFMAAEALQNAAKKLGYRLHLETQGSVGARNPLPADAIREADVVLLATDIEVNVERFAGKRVYRCGTGVALKQPEAMLNKALAEGETLAGSAAPTAGEGAKPAKKEGAGVYKHLLTGVSYMLPMVVAGGLLIALSFVFGITAFKEPGTLAAALMQIGGDSAFKLMVPVLAGYIAYSIADRPGLAPGMIGGWLAASLGSGFIGGIIAGFLAGYVAKAIAQHVKLPASVEALKPILIIPLFASLIVGLVMIYLVGTPVAGALNHLTNFLNNLGTSNAVLLGLILGAMMCIDFGGPINKAAYAFTVGLLASKVYGPMAATMAAGMVPPIGMGIATLLARHKFAQSEREAGKAASVLGLCFISEGAIPFAAKDPLRVIPASVIGGALTGALVMLFDCKLMAPHGGLFVLLIPNAITHAWLYLAAIAAGSLVTGVIYAVLKRSETATELVPAA